MPVISGGGGAAFNGGTITGPLVVTNDTFEVDLQTGAGTAVLVSSGNEVQVGISGHVAEVNIDPAQNGSLLVHGTSNILRALAGPDSLTITPTIALAAGAATTAITSGALPTVSPSSATAFQCSTTRDVYLIVPVTYTLVASTCKVELSPDNVTFSTIGTFDPGAAGAVDYIALVVPAAWRVKLTVTNATLGTGTYY